jgi:CubicO group peptidase (beta-lactamase class C family)
MPWTMPVASRAGALLAGVLACVPALAADRTAGGAPPQPLPPVASAQSAGFSAERLGRLHDFLDAQTRAGGYLGGMTLVARGGRIVDWHVTGHADLARTRSMRHDAIFRVYSMTKPVTSVAILQLLEQGRLGLDDPVTKHLPELASLRVLSGSLDAPQWRAPARPITLRHLLTHTAGFPAGLPGDEAATRWTERDDPHRAADLRGFVAALARGGALAADPGTRFGYEAANTEVLARVVEVVSGRDFAGYLQDAIFAPLRMRDTGFAVPAAERGRVVDITRMSGAGTLELDAGPSAAAPGAPLNPYASGAGGLYSTAADYARFCQMLLDGGTLDGATVLGRKTVELMLANHLAGMLDPPVNQYSDGEGFGLGGYVVLDPARRGSPGSVGQFGWSGAASTNFLIDPAEKLTVILLLQHLPNGAANDLPRIGRRVQTLAVQALVGEAPDTKAAP